VVDWKAYDRAKQEELLAFVREARELVGSMEEPWKRHVMGRPPYEGRPLVLCLLLKQYLRTVYRDVESLLRSSPSLRREIGLDEVPDFKTIQRAMEKLPESYVRELNRRLAGRFRFAR
jgi:hypothetical protein